MSILGGNKMGNKGVTSLGKKLRKIRIENDEVTYDMAEKIGISVSYLSAIENGKRKIPKNFIEILFEVYNLKEEEKKEILEMVASYSGEMKLRLEGMNASQKELSLLYARKISNLSEEQIKKIKGFLNGDE